ncbi:ATP-dependent zinc protease [Candidatus Woesearchaeota archaeon]|nr:ATP-dependent zinc protease [Candidatus Woesearchaeota archaeon]
MIPPMILGTKRNIVIEYKNRTVVGLAETITVLGPKGKKAVTARMDTGATKSSLDTRLAAELKLGPVLKATVINSASGSSLRPVVKATIIICNKEVTGEFTLADRGRMRYRALIGQDILVSNRFLIDPSKQH